jgi:hypothetical protein
MTSITQGSTNVYADLESPDSEQMLLKAQLAEKISQIIQLLIKYFLYQLFVLKSKKIHPN